MERGCIIFRCLRRHGYFCCADCGERAICKDTCRNDPAKCEVVREKVPRIKEVKEYADSRKDSRIV